MNKVIVKLAEAGNGVANAYEGNKEYGYIILNSTEMVMQNGWIQEKNRSCIMRGKVEQLNRMFTPGQELPGKIAVTECTADNIPAKCATQLNQNVSFEEQIEPFLKRAGSQDAPILTVNGQQILRFPEYDATGTVVDVRVQHDNVDEVKAFNTASAGKEASLPK
jgi:hypothetical protein